MNPRSVVPSILEKLEPHLERLELAWSSQSERDRAPTLPLTSEGKVNVRQLVRDLGLRETLEQHFFRKPELAGPVNALAHAQGVKPIGSRLLDDVADAGVRKRLGRDADTISELRKALAEREALVVSLRDENARLKARLDLIEETGLVFRAPA
ncbi:MULTISPECIES: hypothetical protein [unclassified Bradyrhizobium]|uniref:hypothetical protein n=1 Tax=unclassified Bradyrhizobium TaxID=2631580 RepID=UPI00070D293D|nr:MULTISPECIES: hypothetical protein [unclassified Bradyrhizobium]KQT29265.1 hypothetical protein ASG57_01130 [Bradyrhizobium sp. Leaf396]